MKPVCRGNYGFFVGEITVIVREKSRARMMWKGMLVGNGVGGKACYRWIIFIEWLPGGSAFSYGPTGKSRLGHTMFCQ
jgi:hypothetical protein